MARVKKSDQKVFDFIAETGVLMQMSRSQKQQLFNSFDTVASHAYHCAIIAYCLARLEGLSHEDGLKAMIMGTLHDNAEARTGDLNFVQKHYSTTDEEKAIEHQLKGLPFAKDLHDVVSEYENRETLVAKCAKDADSLEQFYQEWIMTHMGNKMAEKWFREDFKHRIPYLKTKSAKRLAAVMKNDHPHKWWFKDLVEKGINYEYLNGKK